MLCRQRRHDEEGLVETDEAERKPSLRRRFAVEPLLILYLVSGFPMYSISSQYLVHKVAESMGYDYDNLTASAGNASDNTCIINWSDPSYIIRESIQAEAANWNMYKSLAGFLPGMVAPIIMGSLADKIGRRLMFIMPCIGSILGVTVLMLMMWFDLPLGFILLDSLEYVFGGMGVMFAGAFAYIADIVPPEKRAFRITVVDGMSLLSGAIANLFVGYWIRAQGFFWPLVFVIGGKGLCLLYAIFLIPETLKMQDEAIPRRKKISSQDLVAALKLSIYDNGTGRRWKINTLLLSFTFAELFSTMGVMTLFVMNTPLCWESVRIGFFSFITMGVQCVTMLVAAYVPSHWVKTEWKVVLGRISSIANSIYIAFVSTSLMMYFAPVLGAFSFLAIPMLRALLSSHVGKDEQASVFSLLGVVFHMSMLSSSLATNKIYQATLFIFHGSIVFFCAAGVSFISLLLMLYYIYYTQKERLPIKVSETEGSIQA